MNKNILLYIIWFIYRWNLKNVKYSLICGITKNILKIKLCKLISYILKIKIML